jgi:D-alanyl-D-alanine endopeptidase (penicillin-binding protein 7)
MHPTLRSQPLRLLAAACLTLLAVQAVARDAHDPKLKSSSVLVIDQANHAVIYAKNTDVTAPIASITKLMTALVVLDAHQPLDQLVQISDADRDPLKPVFSRLAVGTTLSRGDAMHLALMASENRAAYALGNNYPGGMPAMVAAMNAKAVKLGMKNSHFVDPAGLSSQNVSTPDDLTRLVSAASKSAAIREYSTDSDFAVKIKRRMVKFVNTDNLVKSSSWNIIVQKTGYITEAGKCLVMAAVIDGRAVIIVLLDSYGRYTRVADAKRIKTWLETGTAGGHGVRVSMR